MKTLKGAPGLRPKQNTADAIISLVNVTFTKSDRNALKVHFLQLLAGMTAHESISYLGLNSRKLNSYPLEVEHKRANNKMYALYYNRVLKSFQNHIQISRSNDYKNHLTQIANRL